MASALTASIYDGKPTTLRDFALMCARMFGALASMREQGLDAPIPDIIEPTSADYHRARLQHAQEQLARAEEMTEEQAAAAAAEEHDRALGYVRKANAKSSAARERYEAMLAEVNAWTPPTPDHEGLKAYMVEQLTYSIAHDCRPMDEPTMKSGAEFRADCIANARHDIAYYEEQAADGERRAQNATRWVGALKASLPGTAEPPR